MKIALASDHAGIHFKESNPGIPETKKASNTTILGVLRKNASIIRYTPKKQPGRFFRPVREGHPGLRQRDRGIHHGQ